MSSLTRYSPLLVVAPALLYLVISAVPPTDTPGEMKVQTFGKLPVVDGGRVKPMDTMARIDLMVISNRQTFIDVDDKSRPAVRWLLDVMTTSIAEDPPSLKQKVFRIENDQVLDMLGLEKRPGSWRYSIEEIRPKFGELQKQAMLAQQMPEKERDLFNTKVLELMKHLELHVKLALPAGLYAVPPRNSGEEWMTIAQAFDMQKNGADIPALESLRKMFASYAQGDEKTFNKEVDTYRETLRRKFPTEMGNVEFEAFFNHFAPFYHCAVLYVFVFVLAIAGMIVAPQTLNRSAFWLAFLVLIVHTWALFARMYIQGRPPVTNLYSSAVFIGWGCVLLALVLEAVYRNGLGNLVAGVCGSLTMLIAHHLAESGDTLEMMQAVLDTNFWLATHVTCVTLGYTATFVAGFLGILYVVLGVFTPRLDKSMQTNLGQMIYGVVCFATLLSFVGTVLGGIWADQSWGRFWGWDPKENGALLIVIWNALILHARWGGMIKWRGVAVLAVVGNMITGWSWFGTNQLGVGLHAYGFNNTLALWLTIFWFTQLVLVGVGLVPTQYWVSNLVAPKTTEDPTRPAPPPQGRKKAPVATASS